MAKTKTVGRSKSNQIIFDSYQKAITNRMKAGHDVTKMTDRLNKLVNEMKK
jgi:hypothetical protein|tara:strand:- start:707 stop:859 length:153 start_codon:yes stop_codon:yes gene_type:complete